MKNRILGKQDKKEGILEGTFLLLKKYRLRSKVYYGNLIVASHLKRGIRVEIKKTLFGTTKDGAKVMLFTLKNTQNVTVKIITYGGIITALQVPAKDGKMVDLVLGFNTFQEYLGEHPYLGAIIGRYANRITGGRFVINGAEYQLAKNEGKNHLHGGNVGFDKVVWSAEEMQSDQAVGVRLFYLSKDGEEGYPGNLRTIVTYQLTNQNELTIEYEAVTDKPTVVNLTNHSYFNLSGEGSGDVLRHEIMINADQYSVVDEDLIPTGELKPVKDSPLDFTVRRPIGARISKLEGGYDHNYVLNKNENELLLAARVFDPDSKRMMEVFTTEPGIQFYTANFLNGTLKGKSGRVYDKHGAFCLEAQHFPDAPNHAAFPTTLLNPGETYRQKTVYKFSI